MKCCTRNPSAQTLMGMPTSLGIFSCPSIHSHATGWAESWEWRSCSLFNLKYHFTEHSCWSRSHRKYSPPGTLDQRVWVQFSQKHFPRQILLPSGKLGSKRLSHLPTITHLGNGMEAYKPTVFIWFQSACWELCHHSLQAVPPLPPSQANFCPNPQQSHCPANQRLFFSRDSTNSTQWHFNSFKDQIYNSMYCIVTV